MMTYTQLQRLRKQAAEDLGFDGPLLNEKGLMTWEAHQAAMKRQDTKLEQAALEESFRRTAPSPETLERLRAWRRSEEERAGFPYDYKTKQLVLTDYGKPGHDYDKAWTIAREAIDKYPNNYFIQDLRDRYPATKPADRAMRRQQLGDEMAALRRQPNGMFESSLTTFKNTTRDTLASISRSIGTKLFPNRVDKRMAL